MSAHPFQVPQNLQMVHQPDRIGNASDDDHLKGLGLLHAAFNEHCTVSPNALGTEVKHGTRNKEQYDTLYQLKY